LEIRGGQPKDRLRDIQDISSRSSLRSMRATCRLASPAAASATGQTLVLDGGPAAA
jgi:hypothetical protein